MLASCYPTLRKEREGWGTQIWCNFKQPET
jgi:hypothetical protein